MGNVGLISQTLDASSPLMGISLQPLFGYFHTWTTPNCLGLVGDTQSDFFPKQRQKPPSKEIIRGSNLIKLSWAEVKPTSDPVGPDGPEGGFRVSHSIAVTH